MRPFPTRRALIAGAAVGAILLTGGAAFAFWSSTGTGVGAAEVAADASDLTVTPGATVGELAPGGPSVDVVVEVENPNSSAIDLTDVTVTITDVRNASGSSIVAACPIAEFAVTDNAGYDGELIAAGGTSGEETVASIQLLETGVNQDDCKNASLVLLLTAN